MTDCITQPLLFSSLGRKKVEADFNGGHLTSDAGMLLLREVDRRIGLLDALTGCIADPREASKITHDLRTLLAQRILAIAAGYEDGNDHHELRHDPLLQLATEGQGPESHPHRARASEGTYRCRPRCTRS